MRIIKVRKVDADARESFGDIVVLHNEKGEAIYDYIGKRGQLLTGLKDNAFSMGFINGKNLKSEKDALKDAASYFNTLLKNLDAAEAFVKKEKLNILR